MNKVFKIIWNKTTQSFVVTSELAKGAVKASSNSEQRVTSETRLSSLFKLSVSSLILAGVVLPAQAIDISEPLIKITEGGLNMFKGEASVNGGSNIGIGHSATISNNSPRGRNIAIGMGAYISGANSEESIAIGSAGDGPKTQRTEVRGDQSIAIGANTLAQGNSSIAIGNDDLDKVGGTTYIGPEKFIKYDKSGNKTGEYALNRKALRDIYKEMTGDTMNNRVYENTIAGEGSVALGVQANSSAALSLAIGTKSKATVFGATALGTGARATKLNSVALGAASNITKAGEAHVERTILGTTYTWAGGAQVDEGDVVSIGDKGYERQIINLAPGDISATSTDAINGSQLYAAMAEIEKIRYFSVKSDEVDNRNNTGAKGANSIAIGPATTTNTSNASLAIGYGAKTSADGTIALGFNSHADDTAAVSIGNGSQANKVSSVALGTNAQAGDAYAVSIGVNSKAIARWGVALGGYAEAGEAGLAFGYTAKATGVDSMAFGSFANASGANAMALGDHSSATVVNSVALGHASVADSNNFTDSSAYATFKADDGSDSIVTFQAGLGSYAGGAISVGKKDFERQIQNVAAGRLSNTSTDAVNGSQLYAVLNNSGFNVLQNNDYKARINNNNVVKFKNGTQTTAVVTKTENGTDVTFNVNTTTISAGDNGQVNTPANGDAPVTATSVAEAINNTYWNVVANDNTKEAVKAGNTVKFIDGKNIAISQNGKEFTIATSNNVSFDHVDVGPISIDKDAGVNAGNKKISNVAAGEAETDAVNVSQLKAVKEIANKGWNLSVDGGKNKSNIVPDATVDLKSANDNIQITKDGNNVTFKLNDTINVTNVNASGDVKAGDTILNKDGVKVGNDVALTKDGLKRVMYQLIKMASMLAIKRLATWQTVM